MSSRFGETILNNISSSQCTLKWTSRSSIPIDMTGTCWIWSVTWVGCLKCSQSCSVLWQASTLECACKHLLLTGCIIWTRLFVKRCFKTTHSQNRNWLRKGWWETPLGRYNWTCLCSCLRSTARRKWCVGVVLGRSRKALRDIWSWWRLGIATLIRI